MTAWRAISSPGGGFARSLWLALALAVALAGCGDRAGNRGRPASESTLPAALGSAADGIGPYTFALPPMPVGTVARAGGEPPAPDDAAERISPITAPTERDHARGRELFRIYCAPCHGPAGRGDGPMEDLLGVTVRDLGDEAVAGLSDGELFLTITQGSGQMLGLGGLITPSDRWLAVLGVRAVMRAASAGDALVSPDSATPPAPTPAHSP